MRSLATISSGGGFSSEEPARSYISRTFPLAIRGRSASVGGVTWRDASNAVGRRAIRILRGAVHDSEDAGSYRPRVYRPGIEQSGEGPPLVLVHGTPLDRRCW